MPRERSFKNYIADRFYNELCDGIQEFIKDHPRDLDLTLYRVHDIDDINLSDIRVVFVDIHDQPGTGISFDVAVDADIETIEEDKYCNEDEETNQWFMVRCTGDLACGLDDFTINSVSVYSSKIPQPKPMSDALVPIIGKDDLEKVATDFLKRNYPKALLQPMAIDPVELTENMGLEVKLKHIARDCSIFGQIFFQDANAEFYDKQEDRIYEEQVKAKTIFVDPDTYFLYNLGKVNNTIVHECVHWDLHRKAFELERLYNQEASRIKCRAEGGVAGNSWTATEWMEWQANSLAPRIQMPMAMFKTQAGKAIRKYHQMMGKDDIIDVIEPVIDDLAIFFGVSRLAAKIRMVDAGYKEAIGAFIYVDGRYITPHRFKKDSIREDQTFSISAEEAAIQSATNPGLKKLVETGAYLYVDAHFVLNHPRYLVNPPEGMPYLTDYARNHMDECCIPFDMSVRSSDKKDYFSVCYLNKDEDSTVSFDIKYGKGFAHSTADKQAKLVEEIVMEEMRIFRSLPNDFTAAMKIIWNWRGIEYKELADRIHLDDQTISRIVNGKRDPSINSLVLIFLGMHLPPEISFRLIELSPVSLNFAKSDHIWYNFALQHLSKLSMEKIEAFFGEHNVEI